MAQTVCRKLALEGLFTEMCLAENRTCSKQDSVGLGQSSICKTLAVLGRQKQGNPQDSSQVESVSAQSSKRPQFTIELGRGRLPRTPPPAPCQSTEWSVSSSMDQCVSTPC